MTGWSSLTQVVIGPMTEADWEVVLSIYKQGIATGNSTFETQAPDWDTWNRDHLPSCRLVAKREGLVIGWAALSRYSSRERYSGVGVVSVYVQASVRGEGVGKTLLRGLVQESERCGFWTLQASIFPENAASIAIHKACGFREVGRRERIGMLHGAWRDTVIMERRSPVVGV